MRDVLVATGAIFFPLNPFRVQSLVLHREVIAVFALGATEDDLLARHDYRLRAAAFGESVPRRGRAPCTYLISPQERQLDKWLALRTAPE